MKFQYPNITYTDGLKHLNVNYRDVNSNYLGITLHLLISQKFGSWIMPSVGQDVGIRGPLGTAGGHRYSKDTPTNFSLRKFC